VEKPEPVQPIPNQPAPHRRRVRYRGTHPRRFDQKYKEHQPERYADDVRKIIDSGKTPAGSHRPICVREILEILAPRPGEVGVDATLGYGGHALELARALLPNGRLYGLDVDPIELPKTAARLLAAGILEASLVVRRTNFAGLPQLLAEEGLAGVDFVLADLGVSSMQLDDPSRGFSYKHDGPLDLRMNPGRGQSAAALLARLNEQELAALLEENADESRAELIARAVCRAQAQRPILRTGELARVICQALPPGHRANEEADAAVRRSFQAMRIAVNDEFGALETFLRHLPSCLKPGGRAAILTFHSGEDRRVKSSFRDGARNGIYADVAREVIRPGAEEVRANPRASSAKLRWAIRA
jgi:16S rRNA (cytosine1402-N4)-methyltransferase